MAFTGTDVMSSQQYLDKLTELNGLTLAKGRLYYIGDTKAIALATATDEYIPLYENAIGSNLAFSASTRKITYKTPFGVSKELSLASLTVAAGTGEIATNVAAGVPLKQDTLEMAFRRMVNNLTYFEGSEHITSVGTITSGTWEGDTIAVASGGTGKKSVGKDKMLYASSANVYAEVTTTSFGRGILAAASGVEVANLHAATATKLHTAVTIWGQSFDGSKKIEGAFSGATTGAFSSNVTVGGYLKVGSADGSYVQIGALRLVYDAANKAIKLIDPSTTTPANANFYATGSVAAFGPGTISGGGTSISLLETWDGYDDASMSTWALSAGLGHDLLLRTATINSPIFTGTPKAPTAASTVKDTQIATTAFVHNVVTNALTSVFSYKGTSTVEAINARGNGSTPVGSAFRLSSSGEITKAEDSDKDAAIGDMVICTQLNPIQWSILQNNIDTVDLESRLDTVETLLTWILPTA